MSSLEIFNNKALSARTEINNSKFLVKDELFGNLWYGKNPLKLNSNFDRDHWICRAPFTSVEIKTNGDVGVCCEVWSPIKIGNLTKDDLHTIWTGERANAMRATMLDKSFKYCNSSKCPRMYNPKSGMIDRSDSEQVNSLINYKDFPSNILLMLDNSCNLKCPSCRNDYIMWEDQQLDFSYDIASKIFGSIFKKPHTQNIDITMDGSGEFFGSQFYRTLLDTELCFKHPELWPNTTYSVLTNGTLMTKKIQNKYEKFMDRVRYFVISIDAGNRESYAKVRGGDWDLLLDNLKYLYETRLKHNKNLKWRFNLVAQRDNINSLPDLINIANTFPENLPYIWVSRINNWGTMSPEEYKNKSSFELNKEKLVYDRLMLML